MGRHNRVYPTKGADKLSVNLCVPITKATSDRLAIAAERKEMNKAEFVRSLVLKALES